MNDVKKIISPIEFVKTPIVNVSLTEFEYKEEKYSLMATMLKGQTQDFISLENLVRKL